MNKWGTFGALWGTWLIGMGCGGPQETSSNGSSTPLPPHQVESRPSPTGGNPSAPAASLASTEPPVQDLPAGKTDIDRWLAYQGLSRTQIVTILEAQPEHIRAQVEYANVTDLIEVRNVTKDPAYFHFHGEAPVILMVSLVEELRGLRGSRLTRQLGGRGTELRSRACSLCVEHIFPERGVAFTTHELDKVTTVEIFPPTTLEKYLADFYVPPRSPSR